MSNENVRVLVIDDSSTIRKIAEDMLVKSDFEVVLGESVEDAMEKHGSDTVSVIVSDLIMPGIGGVAGISLMREQWPNAGVIAMTAGSKQISPTALLNIARSAGAHRLLEKPFKDQDLVELVRGLLSEGYGTNARKRKIIVVDDSATLRKMFEKVLVSNGYDCFCMESAEQAVASPELLGVDCVITDIFMPGKGGIAGIQEIKASWPKVPIIAMSGGVKNTVGANDALIAAKKCGADATLQKPFPPQELLNVIESLT